MIMILKYFVDKEKIRGYYINESDSQINEGAVK